MLRRGSALVIVCGIALGVSSCSSDSPKSAATSTTTGTTTATTPSTTSNPTVVDSTAATADSSSSTTTTSGSANSSGVTTTAAGRVVTSPSDSVHLGDSGAGVREIQTALANQGYKVTVDGQFGPQTDRAVKAFQAQAGIKTDGIVGPVTWAKLKAASTATTVKGTTSASTTTVKATTTTT